MEKLETIMKGLKTTALLSSIAIASFGAGFVVRDYYRGFPAFREGETRQRAYVEIYDDGNNIITYEQRYERTPKTNYHLLKK